MDLHEFWQYIIPVLAFTALTGGWMAVQILAKKMKTKNHIDSSAGCCGACTNKGSCTTKSHA